jgi:hypothetical protein
VLVPQIERLGDVAVRAKGASVDWRGRSDFLERLDRPATILLRARVDTLAARGQ